MRALTIFPVFAELIAAGVKRIENRSRPTTYRGPLFIHASRKRRHDGTSIDAIAQLHALDPSTLAPGCIIAIVDLVDCMDVESARLRVPDQSAFASGPWCWLLANPRRLPEPIPAIGQLGLWRADLQLQPEVVSC